MDNQAYLRQAVYHFKANWHDMMKALSVSKRQRAVVTVQSYFYLFVRQDLRQDSSGQSDNEYSVLAPYLKQMTHYAQTVAAQQGFKYIDLMPILNGSYESPQGPRDLGLANEDDPLHPNSRGHALITDVYRAFGYAPLYPKQKPRSLGGRACAQHWPRR